MAHTHKIPYESSQWSIDYQSAWLQPENEARYQKFDLAVQTCLSALHEFLDDPTRELERIAIRTALSDMIILRSITARYS